MEKWFLKVLEYAIEKEASDIHLSSGSPIVFRIHGELTKIDEKDNITPAILSELIEDLLPDNVSQFENSLEDYDFSFEVENLSRFRINVYNQLKGPSVAIRILPNEIKSLAKLGLPMELKKICKKKNGIFLVTGPTGSGKTTTIAAMIDFINEKMKKHIITLEHPIEYKFENKNSIIEQREIGTNIRSFSEGLRSALRQDPDVIFVGELRDLESISTALTAAETGHLVLGTLHTQNAPKTIDRIIDTFPAAQQSQIRSQLSSVLLGVLSQQLIPTANNKGRILVSEFLLNNTAIANLIRTENTHQIHNQIQTGKKEGMHTMQDKLQELIGDQIVDNEQSHL